MIFRMSIPKETWDQWAAESAARSKAGERELFAAAMSTAEFTPGSDCGHVVCEHEPNPTGCIYPNDLWARLLLP